MREKQNTKLGTGIYLAKLLTKYSYMFYFT